MNFENNMEKTSPQDIIKQKLLSSDREINDFVEFKKRWLDLDQEGDHSKNARLNIDMLESEEIINAFEELGKEMEKERYKMLSISFFHEAQRTSDINFFRKAVEYAEKNVDLDYYKDWVNYVRGTLAYFEKEIDKLEEIINMTDVGKNKNILENLLLSLESGEDPVNEYKNVYEKQF